MSIFVSWVEKNMVRASPVIAQTGTILVKAMTAVTDLPTGYIYACDAPWYDSCNHLSIRRLLSISMV